MVLKSVKVWVILCSLNERVKVCVILCGLNERVKVCVVLYLLLHPISPCTWWANNVCCFVTDILTMKPSASIDNLHHVQIMC